MNLVQTVEAGDPHLVHRNVLNLADELPVSTGRIGHVVHRIQDRSDLVLADKSLTLRRDIVRSGLDYIFGSELGHLPHLLLECHLPENLPYLRLHFPVCRNGRSRTALTRAEQPGSTGERNHK